MIYLLIVTIFWLAFYIFKCLHDGYAAMELREVSSYKNVENKKKYNLLWHVYDTIEKTIVHITFTALFTIAINETLLYSVLLLSYGVGIRIFIYDGIINLVRGMGWNAYSTCDYKGDWWDCFIVKMRDLGISQQVIKGLVLILSTIAIIMYIL